MKNYSNPFHNPNNSYSRKEFVANESPVLHEGYEIHTRNSNEIHIVKNDICVGMVGSIDAAKKRIETNKPPLFNKK